LPPSRTKPLLVGEDNPYGSDPRYALYPAPKRSAGWRLCHLVLGLSVTQYVRGFDRVNLCARKWSTREAGESAQRILRGPRDRAVILLGAKVTEAHGYAYQPFAALGGGDFPRLICLPHPSGRSRAWNDPGAFARAREALTRVGALPVPPPTREERLEELPSASMSTARPARCECCGGLVEGMDCPECGSP
jgi:hypothetical protein